MSPAEWRDFLKSDAATWLPKPGEYPSGAKSYFTPKGRSAFVEKTLPVIKDFIGYVKEIAAPGNLPDPVYVDEFQHVYTPRRLEFRQVLNGGELRALLREMPSYTDNPRLKMSQFEKYLADDGAFATLWYGCFYNGKCMSLAVLKKYHDDDVILLAEVQSIVKGYGRPLIENILARSRNIWWCADPDGGKSLLEYYRQFGLKEYLIRKSKWVDGRPETAFYKAKDPEAEQVILRTLRAADMERPEYHPERIVNRGIKDISFPENEIQNLIGKQSLWTTRVSDDFQKYGMGDLIRTPWNGLYAVTKEIIVDGVENHPFLRELTKS